MIQLYIIFPLAKFPCDLLNSTMSSILAIDSGNSHLKWGYFADNQWIMKSKVSNHEICYLDSKLSKFDHIGYVVASSVANRSTKVYLEQLLSKMDLYPTWIYSKPFQCGVTNHYKNPSQLGSDRWAAIIAAWNMYHYPCIVVNIGTAITVDAITDKGNYIGGYIFPGPYILKQSLLENTQIELIEDIDYQVFPKSSSSAIHSGIVLAVIGLIEKAQQLFKSHLSYSEHKCILTGGGANFLKPYLQVPYVEFENLVLEGLIIIAQDLVKTS